MGTVCANPKKGTADIAKSKKDRGEVKKEIENPQYITYDGPHFKNDKDARTKVADWLAMPDNL